MRAAASTRVGTVENGVRQPTSLLGKEVEAEEEERLAPGMHPLTAVGMGAMEWLRRVEGSLAHPETPRDSGELDWVTASFFMVREQIRGELVPWALGLEDPLKARARARPASRERPDPSP